MRIFGDAGLLEEESGFAFGYAGAGKIHPARVF
jgi:hypothetical protein